VKFIELYVKTASIVHGFDVDNNEIFEHLSEENFVKKLVAVQRIQSISEQYILVSGSHGRVMYWEYNCDMDDLLIRLRDAGLLVP